MKKKRAQISVFIIIGLFIVFVAGLLTYLATIDSEHELPQQGIHESSVQLYIQDCVDRSLQMSIFKLGVHGGYMHPKYIYSGEFFDTSYLFYEDKNLVPSIYDLEKSISFYMNYSLVNECKFDVFDNYEFNIGLIQPVTKITDEKVFVQMHWPIKIQTSEDSKIISEFSSTKDIGLVEMHSFVADIVESHEKDKIEVISLLRPGYNVTVVPQGEDIVYMIKDTKTKVLGEPFVFMFAMKDE